MRISFSFLCALFSFLRALVICACSSALLVPSLQASEQTLWQAFSSPPQSAKPWCYWWWVNGNVDHQTISDDLAAMRDLGFGGIVLFDSRGYWEDDEHLVSPKVDLVWGSEAWFDRVAFAIRACARQGLVFTMNASASGGKLNGFRNGVEYDVDIMNRQEVRAHLDHAIVPLIKRVPELVGSTFTHLYSVSYEGSIRTGGSWKAIGENFYAEMSAWAREHGLKVFSESGGPWCWDARSAKLDCDQQDLLAHNDFPQGEFWPLEENATCSAAGHANRNARYFSRAIVKSAQAQGKLASVEAFTHMHHHWSVDPAFLKPLADMAYADGINRFVWHTYTCSPKKFGVPGAEYFAGSHVNRNVTWHRDAAPFIKYLARCQALLQRGTYVDDGEFLDVQTNYFGWGRFRKDPAAAFTTTHRREGKVDFFFVAGEGHGALLLNAPLADRLVELWDPVSGTRTTLGGMPAVSGASTAAVVPMGNKTRVELDLPTAGSCFLVFLKARQVLSAPWSLAFAYHEGIAAPPPNPVTLDTLQDISRLGSLADTSSTSLRYFSGTVTYRTTIDLSAEDAARAEFLSIGKLPTGTARVVVNGREAGVVWCAPWRVSLVPSGMQSGSSTLCQPGKNAIEIRYTNNWYNRLVGDCHLPPEKRVTRSTVHYWNIPRTGDTNNFWLLKPRVYSGPAISDKLQPSGLLGPVEIHFTASH